MSFNELKEGLKTPFNVLWTSLWSVMPDRSKRMCLLTSLYVCMTGYTEDDTDKLDEMNRELTLSRDTNALRFPALVSPLIWRSTFLKKPPVTDSERSELFITRLIKKTPCWLKYGDEQTMRDDMRKLLMAYQHSVQ